MARRVRLPGLPIFRKYSLALRQEFARPDELIGLLQESINQVEAALGAEPEVEPPRPIETAKTRPAAPAPPQAFDDDVDDDEAPESFLKEEVRGGAAVEPSPVYSGPRALADAEQAGQPPAGQFQELPPEEQEDFWGEARPWAVKRHKSKLKDSRGRSARPAIVQVDSEGAAVKGKARSKDK